MSEIISTDEYFAAVSAATRYYFDRTSKKRYELRDLFFRQRFVDGQHAFTRYEDLLEESESGNTDPSSEKMLQEIREFYKKPLANEHGFPQEKPNKKNGNNDSKIVSMDTKKISLDSKEISSIISQIDNYQRKEQTDSLFKESKREICEKLIFSSPNSSRVLVIGNAGLGKTTLIHRIALALTTNKNNNTLDFQRDNEYLLSIEDESISHLIPCIISLRNIHDDIEDIESLIVGTIASMLHKENSMDAIRNWLMSIQNDLLLLIDGLDELPSCLVVPFLCALERYVSQYNTRVILTSRVSGVDNDETIRILKKLKFRGRTILPLNDDEAKRFCNQWITTTRNSKELMNNLERIQSEPHLRYLREFIRKPLELVILLQYLPRQQSSTFNRWDLFSNILWLEITNHTRFEDKQSVFDDECKFLGYIAYQMQIRNKMSLNFSELKDITPSIEQMSFYTDIFETKNRAVTSNDIWLHLKKIAQNIGIVETITSSMTVAIPIRSYQEFLVAYACCNLCLDESELSPNPSKILKAHLNDKNWLGVLGFSIANMEYNELADYDDFLLSLYSTAESIGILSTLMEIDYFNSREVAKSLCKSRFSNSSLDVEEKRLLKKCMQTKSAFAFRWAVTALFRDSYQNGSQRFLEATSISYYFDTIYNHRDIADTINQLLQSKKEYENVIGAGLVALCARIALDEEPESFNYYDDIIAKIPDKTYSLLYGLAISTESFAFILALTELFNAETENSDAIKTYLDQRLLQIACNCLYCNSERMSNQLLTIGTLGKDYFYYLRNVVQAIGMFPYPIGKCTTVQKPCVWIPAFVSALYELSFNEMDLDQVGIATCKYHITGDFEEFITSWVEDICKGRKSSEVRKNHLTKRENNHFIQTKKMIVEDESNYHEKVNLKANRLSMFDDNPTKLIIAGQNVKANRLSVYEMHPAKLFIDGQDAKALEVSLRLYHEGKSSNNNNLAFLVRYLKYDTKATFNIPRREFIEALLYSGVKEHEPYSTMNYALCLLESGNSLEASKLLHSISPENLASISNEFWYPIMWKQRNEIEGALVCVLSQNAGGANFPEYEAMVNTIKEKEPLWLNIL